MPWIIIILFLFDSTNSKNCQGIYRSEHIIMPTALTIPAGKSFIREKAWLTLNYTRGFTNRFEVTFGFFFWPSLPAIAALYIAPKFNLFHEKGKTWSEYLTIGTYFGRCFPFEEGEENGGRANMGNNFIVDLGLALYNIPEIINRHKSCLPILNLVYHFLNLALFE